MRASSPQDKLTPGFALKGGNGITFESEDRRPYKNPLFKFMFFVDPNDFAIEDIQQLVRETEDKYLPNLICLLDKGVIFKASILGQFGSYSLGHVELFPKFIKKDSTERYEGVFLEFGEEKFRAVGNFAFIIYSLNVHLKDCLMVKPDILKYFNGMPSHKGEIIF